MGSFVLVDNDVVLKCSCYRLVDETVSFLSSGGRVAVLGSARFVLEKYVGKTNSIVDKEAVIGELGRFFAQTSLLEPNDAELSLAAELEGEAQLRSVALDIGESLLVAILLLRSAPLLVTGDKRAIAAVEALVAALAQLEAVAGRLACIEQLVLGLVQRLGTGAVRKHICGEPGADKALALCFSCSRACVDGNNVIEGLSSYINSLRTTAKIVLLTSHDLSSVIA